MDRKGGNLQSDLKRITAFVGHSDFITALAGYDTKPALVASSALDLLATENDPAKLDTFASALAIHSTTAERALREKAEMIRAGHATSGLLQSAVGSSEQTEQDVIRRLGGSSETIPALDLRTEAGLVGGFFEVFATPPLHFSPRSATEANKHNREPEILERSYALDETVAGIGTLLSLERQSNRLARIARSSQELVDAQACGAFAAVLHLADADSIDVELKTLNVFYELGVRSVAITWSRRNAFGYGVPFRAQGTPDIGPGLTEAGIRLVQTCNQMGIVIDLAHLNEAGFWDVAKHSHAPLVVTHGAAHRLAPTSRAYTDRQLAAISESGGVIGISLEGLPPSPEGVLSDMVRQIDHLIDRVGLASVALGTDLYRKPCAEQPGGHSLLPELLASLKIAGYDDSSIEQIARGNWVRVLNATWKPAIHI